MVKCAQPFHRSCFGASADSTDVGTATRLKCESATKDIHRIEKQLRIQRAFDVFRFAKAVLFAGE